MIFFLVNNSIDFFKIKLFRDQTHPSTPGNVQAAADHIMYVLLIYL